MIRTFLVAVELADNYPDLDVLAADMQDALLFEGFDVQSVKPWAGADQATLSSYQITPDASLGTLSPGEAF